VNIHEKYNCCRPDCGTAAGICIGDAQPRGGRRPNHLQGRNHHNFNRQRHLQRSWRRAKVSRSGTGQPDSGGIEGTCGTSGIEGPGGRRDHDLLGWHNDHVDRQRHLQRPRRDTESDEVQTGGNCSRDRTRCCCDDGRRRARRARRSRCNGTACCACCIDHCCQVSHGDQVGPDGQRQQHGSDRGNGEVQGRHLFEVHSPQWNVFKPRRRGRVADCRQVAPSAEETSGGGDGAAALDLFVEQRL
jgi:hypothetical protein